VETFLTTIPCARTEGFCEKVEDSYRIDIEGDVLTFNTGSFRVGEGSMLNKGIFSPELTSSLVSAAAVIVLVAVALINGLEFTAAYYATAVAVFAVLFVLLRKFVFYEEYLEASVDRAAGKIKLRVHRPFGDRRTYELARLAEVAKGSTEIEPGNPDGAEFVVKIAAQHGTLMPGFGEKKVFHSVELVFEGGDKYTLFSSEDEVEAAELALRLRNFIGGGVAKAD
jgi:hypothetical protein